MDWATKFPGRNFYVHSRRFDTRRKAYAPPRGLHVANMVRHAGQADQIDFVAVDPNDDKLRDDVLAAVQEMGARTVAEEQQEDRPDIHPRRLGREDAERRKARRVREGAVGRTEERKVPLDGH